MKTFVRCLMLVAALCVAWATNAQNLAEYRFSTGTDASKWITLTTDTNLLGTGYVDNRASSLLNIGFAFPYGDSSYTQFSVNSDGNLRLGSTVTGTGNYTTPFSSTNSNSNGPKINFFGCDGYFLDSIHYVYAENTVDANNDSLLVVEFCLGTYTTSTRYQRYKWQVHLYPNGNIVVAYAATAPVMAPAVAHQKGFCINSTNGMVIGPDNQYYCFHNGSTIAWAANTWPAPNTFYTFTPTNSTCTMPSAITLHDVGTTTATLSLTPSCTSSTWIAYITPAVMGMSSYPITDTMASLMFLTPNTDYMVRVRTLCGVGDTSNAQYFTFHTRCADITAADLPYTEDFSGHSNMQAYPYYGPSVTPHCWDFYSNGTNTVETSGTSVYYGGVAQYTSTSSYGCIEANNPYLYMPIQLTGANVTSSTYLNYGVQRGSVKYAVLPAITQALNGLQISFDYKMSSAYSATAAAATLELGYVTGDTSTFQSMQSYQAVTTLQHVEELNLATLAASAPAGARLAFKFSGVHNGTGTSSYSNVSVGIDNILIEMLPTCSRITDLAVSNVGINSATLTWNDTLNTGASYTVYDMADTSVVATGITATTYVVTGLTSNTQYTFGVMANCSATDNSQITTVSTRTNCDVFQLPFTENFSAYTGLPTYPYYGPSVTPFCWDYYSNGTNTVETSTTSAYYGGVAQYTSTSSYGCIEANNPYLYMPIQLTGANVTSSTYLNYGIQRGSVKYAVLPAFAQSLNGLQISFDYKMSTAYSATASAATLELGYITGDTSTFQSMQSYQAVTTLQHVIDLNLATLAASAPAGARLAFKFSGVHNGTGTSSYSTVSLGIDNIVVEILPTCRRVTDLAVSNVGINNATLTWNDALNTGATYTVYDMADTSVVATGITATTYMVTGLTSNTQYTFGVMANCSATDNSSMATVSTRTSCDAYQLPFTEDFSANLSSNFCWRGATGTTAAQVFAGTSLNLTTPNWSYVSSTRDGLAGGHYYKNVYGTSIKSWIITPAIDLSTVSTAQLSFDVALTDYNNAALPDENGDTNTSQAFMVIVSTDGGNTWSASNATVWQNVGGDYTYASLADTVYQNKVISLNQYVGDTIKIAFYAQSLWSGGDNDLHIDNLSVTGESLVQPGLHVTVASADTTMGTTIPAPGTYDFYAGDTMNFLAVANPGYQFVNWTASSFGVTDTSTINPIYSVLSANIIDMNVTLTANFEPVGNTCNVTIYAEDEYGDGWNGNTITIMQGTDTVGSYSMPDQGMSSTRVYDTVTFAVQAGIPVSFGWTTGSWASEVSFSILDGSGSAVYSCTDGDDLSDVVFFTLSDPCPTCAGVQNLAVSNLTTNSATLVWTSDNNNATYTVYDMSDTSVIASGLTAQTYTITGLSFETNYQFGVAVNCSATESSSIATVNAFTGYCLPNPTSVDNSGITSVSFGGMTNTTHPSSAMYANYSSMSGSVPAGTTATVDITYATSYTYGTIIWVDWNSNLLFEGNEVVYVGTSTSSNPTTLTATFDIPATQALGSYRMRILGADSYFDDYTGSIAAAANANPCGTYSYGVAEDYTLNVIAMPNCMPVTDLAAEATYNSVTLTWSDTNNTGATYTVYNMSDTSVVASGITATTYTVTGLTPVAGLTPNTNYTFGVVSNCSATDASYAVNVNIRTSCGFETLPFTEDFSANLSSNPCWRGASGTTAAQVFAGASLNLTTPNWSYASSTRDGLAGGHYYKNVYGSSVKSWIITPAIDLSTVTSAQLSFDVALTDYYNAALPDLNGDTNTSQAFMVIVSPDGGNTWSAANATVWQNGTGDYTYASLADTVYQNKVISLNQYVGDTIKIAFYCQSLWSGGDNDLHIDNIAVTEGGQVEPGCTNTCQITIYGEDSYGDGWNGGYISIVQNDSVIATFTVSEEEESANVTVCGDSPVSFIWSSGSYDYEASFTILDGGGSSVYTCFDGSELDADSVFFTLNGACPSCSGIMDLAVSDFTTSSITLTWTSGNTGATYTVYDMSDTSVIASGLTMPTYTITGLTAETNYLFGVAAICSATDSSSIATINAFTGYCIPHPTSVDNDGITSVSFGGMTNTTHPSSATYANYSSMSGSVPAGTTATVDITYATSYTYGTIIWVDWNSNLLFEGNEVVYVGTSTSSNPTTLTATFDIPATQALGSYRMRILGADSYFDDYTGSIAAAANANPCGTYSYGVAEDYTLIVTAMPNCMPITGLTATPTYNSVTLTWTDSNNTGATYTVYDMSDTSVVASGITATTYTATGLNSNSNYTFGVVSNCSATESSLITSVSFHTEMAPIMCGTDLADIYTNADSATSTTSYIPGYSYYNYAYTEVIVPAERLTGLGEIKGMAFEVANYNASAGQKFNNCEIYLMNTTATSLTAGFIQDTNNFQLVYTGDLNYESAGWRTVTFDTSFQWNGISNVLVAVRRNNGSWASGSSFSSYTADSSLARYVNRDGSAYTIGEITDGTATTNVPVYRLIGCESTLPAPVTINIATANATMGTTVPAPGTYTYNVGDSVSAAAVANPGFHFTYWVLSLGILTDTIPFSSYSDVIPAIVAGATFNLTAHFAPNQYTLTATANSPMMGTVTGSGTYNHGSTATLTAVPNTNTHFVQWNDGDTHATRTVVVTSDTTFTATFAYNPVTVTLINANPTMGTTNPVPGTYTFNLGDSIGALATANTGYHFVNWILTMGVATDTITDNPIGEVIPNLPMFAGMNFTVTANFAPNQYTLTVAANDTTMGTTTGSGTYNYGSTATITATPATHYHFVQWNDGDTHATRSVVVTGNATYTATFAPNQYTLTVVANDNTLGSVTGSGTYTYLSTATITATPANHCIFVQWNDGDTNATRTVVVTDDATYTATFQALPQYELTLTAVPEEGGTVTGAGNYYAGESVTIIANPNDGYHFLGWAIEASGDFEYAIFSNEATYTFSMEEQNLHFYALFEEDAEPVSVTVTINNPDWGHVLINGVQTNTVTVNVGDNIVLEAVAADGFHFDRWEGVPTVNDTIPGPVCSFTVTEDININCFFAENVGINDVVEDNIVIYSENSSIMVRGAEQQTIRVFDVVGRMVAQRNATAIEETIQMPSTGVYLVQIGNRPARRVVVRK